jgi:hypothetical protein
MMHRIGRRTPAALVTLVLAAVVGATPAPAAGNGHNHSDLAACNALLPDSALELGSLDAARAAAGRGGAIRHEPFMSVKDIEVPAGAVPDVPADFTATIPVYFHVINKGPTIADGNVSQAQIEAQIAVLNETFSGARGGPDTGFRFELVEVTRTTNEEWFYMAHSRVEREAKRALHEGGSESLNIYSNSGAGYLGFAYYPKNVRGRPYIDGIVIAYDSMPGGDIANYDEGFTATHEIGHWLGLAHTFQNGCSTTGDRVDDTPAQRFPTTGCPEGQDTCPKDPGLDPIHNYMDYSYDDCYTEFTAGQAQRMAEQWLFFRAP